MVRGGLSGVMVRIVGKSPVLSGPNGAFVFADVTPPYDIYIVGTTGLNSASFKPTVYYVVGVTRSDPVVSAPQLDTTTTFPPTNSTTVAGAASGGDARNPLTVIWDGGGQTTTTTGAYSFDAEWSPATETTTGTLYGFQFSRKPNGAPDVFTGYGTSGVVGLTGTVGQTGPIPASVDLNLVRPMNAALTGTITPPPGFDETLLELDLQVGTKGAILTLWPDTITTVVDATIPVVSASKASLVGLSITSGNGRSVFFAIPDLTASADISMVLPPPPEAVGPVGNATGVTSVTEFSWTSSPKSIYQVDVNSSGTEARYVVETASAMLTLPVIPEVPLPRDISFHWTVVGLAPYASIDDAVGAAAIRTSLTPLPFDGTAYTAGFGGGGNFVTAP
jgi:hypothetical protein